MGWIRINTPSHAKSLHKLAVNIEESHRRENQLQCSEHLNATQRTESDIDLYPIIECRMTEQDLPTIPSEVVMKCDGEDGRRLWIVVNDIVLDCTAYIRSHPGGRQIIHGFGGQDCSWQWFTFHDRKIWNDVASKLRVGRTRGIENRHEKPEQFVGLRGFGYRDD